VALFLLDTDIMTLWLYANERVRKRFDAVVNPDRVAITIVTHVELFRGRFAAVVSAATGAECLAAQHRLEHTQTQLAGAEVVPITEEVAEQFDALRSLKKLNKMGAGDRLQAALALAHGATLVTRNTKDFAQVPNLKLDNWTD
jgi:tRNA(fMet)-specific endonuclease VapC